MPTFIRLCLLSLVFLLTACNGEGASGVDSDGRIKWGLQMNWVPEPEFGGYYAARTLGAFRDEGIEIDLRPGGPGVPVMQMVASGQVEFGITSADSVLVARERGVDVVAIFALYQTFPEGIMVHAQRGLNSLAEVFEGGTLAMEAGTPFQLLLAKRFGLQKVRAVPFNNNLGPFLNDPLFAQQCFVTAEPIAARRAGVEPRVFPMTDIGYNPYAGVIFTRRKLLQEYPEQVAGLLRAVRRGWQDYLENPAATNALMQTLNPTMEPETFAEAANIQKPLITGTESPTPALGTMKIDRWAALAAQLQEVGLIGNIAPESVFVNP